MSNTFDGGEYDCLMCGEPTPEHDLSWCYTCNGEICGCCECGHDTWTEYDYNRKNREVS